MWWYWVLLGVVLLTADIVFIKVYYLIWFGASAVLTGTVLLIFPSLPLWAQIILFTLASVVSLFLWLRIWQPRKVKADLSVARKYLLGQVGIVMHFVAVRFADGSDPLRLQHPIGGINMWQFVRDIVDYREVQTHLLGQVGVVVRFTNGRGTLRLQRPVVGHDVWEFVSDAKIRPGDRLVVERSIGGIDMWQFAGDTVDYQEVQTHLPGQVGVVVRFANGRGTLRLQRSVAGHDVWEFVSDAKIHPGDRLVVKLVNDGWIIVDAVVVPLSPPSLVCSTSDATPDSLVSASR